jgi:L-asparaginase II
MRYTELAHVVRNGFVESRHFGSAVVVGPAGEVVLACGVPDEPVLPRSTVKPLQALACLLADAPLSGREVAIAAGSHTGEDMHLDVVEGLLKEVSLTVDALGCPPDWPEDEPTRHRLIRAGENPQPVRMNCSGKHAAMLAACAVNGWSTDDYLDAAHPLQRRVRETVEELSGGPVAHVAVDGCGAPLFGLALRGLADAFRALATAPEDTPAATVADAMRTYPEYVGGSHGHLNTMLMRSAPGIIAKGGAEGVLAAATPDGYAVAVKVIDGSPRATTVIAIAALRAAGVPLPDLAELATAPVLGGGQPVGEIRPTLD